MTMLTNILLWLGDLLVANEAGAGGTALIQHSAGSLVHALIDAGSRHH